MDKLLVINIKELLLAGEGITLKKGTQMDTLESIKGAFVYAQDGKIAAYGTMEEMPKELAGVVESRQGGDYHACQEYEIIDAAGKYVMPTFCDSHTHLIYAGSREREFVDKIKGLSYQQIAANDP